MIKNIIWLDRDKKLRLNLQKLLSTNSNFIKQK
jgi:hypothetical protein